MDYVSTGGLSGAAILAGFIIGCAILLLVSFLAVKMWRYRDAPAVASSFEDFSLTRYQPMVRLLSGEDLEFLASQPGCKPQIIARLRSDRRRIFRMYLRDLVADFQLLHAAARKIAAVSPDPNPKLVAALMRQQITFWWALAGIELRLLLPGTSALEIGDLIASVEALRLDVAKMAA